MKKSITFSDGENQRHQQNLNIANVGYRNIEYQFGGKIKLGFQSSV